MDVEAWNTVLPNVPKPGRKKFVRSSTIWIK